MVHEDLRLKERFGFVRQCTEAICSPLAPEDHVVQPVVDVSPPKWHLGHTTWFFETFILIPEMKGYRAFDKNYNFLFNSYYETVGARVVRTDRGNITRPTVKEVLDYRKYVNEHMNHFLDSQEELSKSLSDLMELGIQHEQQHQELLCYDIKYILGNNPIFPVYLNKTLQEFNEPARPEFQHVDGGVYEIGYNGDGFCFDNELGIHKVYLHDYAIMDRLVTNGEYLEFILAKGYEDFRHWLSDGWEWVKNNSIKAPAYWYSLDGHWYEYSLNGGLKPLDLNAPVTHVSLYEADAYAKWKGLRLPTEFEWEVACSRHLGVNDNSNFMESENFQPMPQKGNNNQMYGDVWEWTNSAYLPYPFYKAPEGAVGEYNGKFMINQMVLRGGSCATPKDHIRATYRNFFHPHLRWMFSGIRLAKNQ
ncbi:ergothioneine biosynthesis protein EgtB [Fulvivirga sp. 29W222]|uniref:Ergothioneine biosynthesis protein EgtB n=1 Tax=Fulvivirga marina TaxID=2494733 RepID=A0A937FW75_9BACT|nr:ergothioneine biosynthesis protein EgtB [Fulvivirga marina]MBL6447280.1 ergothioneine biosynthesis protein EgtB [Fulvivirga marina]